jgi:hypothetical protein
MPTPLYTLWINGILEYAARDTIDKVRATITVYNIPEYLWTFVTETVI